MAMERKSMMTKPEVMRMEAVHTMTEVKIMMGQAIMMTEAEWGIRK